MRPFFRKIQYLFRRAPILATIFLVFFGVTYQYLFLILGIILLVGIPLAMTLEQTGGVSGWRQV